MPPLRYEMVHRLKREFPELHIAINGGITTTPQVAEQLDGLDGVMLGREAYHNPWWMAEWDAAFFGLPADEARTRESVEEELVRYMEREARVHGTQWHSIARHMMGLRHGLPGARRWRQVWSDHRMKDRPPAEVMALAHGAAQPMDEAVVA